MAKLKDLFDVFYGSNLELNKLNQVKNGEGINFVSRTRNNNGVSAIVERLKRLDPLEAGLITVAASGNSVMESFVQPEPFYTGRDVYILRPKMEMSLTEKQFYCMCLKKNRYRFSYGRQANRTLKELLVPDRISEWVYNIELSNYAEVDKPYNSIPKGIDIYEYEWKDFIYSDLFTVLKGKRVVKNTLKPGNTPYITATEKNNGVTDYCELPKMFKGNTITVNYDGSVGEAYYQPKPYYALDSVNVLYPKFELNVYIAMFLITLIRKEKPRYNYGRKWHKERMEKSIIKLPIDNNGNPNWVLMEDYIKSLAFSKSLQS